MLTHEEKMRIYREVVLNLEPSSVSVEALLARVHFDEQVEEAREKGVILDMPFELGQL